MVNKLTFPEAVAVIVVRKHLDIPASDGAATYGATNISSDTADHNAQSRSTIATTTASQRCYHHWYALHTTISVHQDAVVYHGDVLEHHSIW